MTDLTRREASRLLSSLLLPGFLAGCVQKPTAIPHKPAVQLGPMIDAHCHIFNGSDLPAERFIKYAILDAYPRQAQSTLDIQDPDALDGLIALLAWIIGKSSAPSADEEIEVLESKAAANVAAVDPTATRRQAVANAAEFLGNGAIGVESDPQSHRRFTLIRNAVVQAAGGGPVGVENAPMTVEDAQVVADRAYHSDSVLGRYMRWASLLTRYRYALADELIAEHRSQGFRPILLTPALVDYCKWLGQEVSKSPLPRQVEVMASIARRGDVPIHGYVGFDPLRAAYFRKRPATAVFDPHALVRHALGGSGFLGVKLYPPMGFRPIGNAGLLQNYPEDAVQTLGQDAVGHELDLSLAQLYDICVELHAPILAHAAASNGVGPDYSSRGDPAHWLPVFARWPKLHVCLAHFGAFDVASEGVSAMTFPERSWEWAFGRYLVAHPEAPIFVDVSYFSEVLDTSAWHKYAAFVRAYISQFDPECQHMIFGTDWVMLGREKGAETYSTKLHDFFKTACGLDQPKLDRLFFGNAIRFLGLRNGDATRARLLRFYEANRLPTSRLPNLD